MGSTRIAEPHIRRPRAAHEGWRSASAFRIPLLLGKPWIPAFAGMTWLSLCFGVTGQNHSFDVRGRRMKAGAQRPPFEHLYFWGNPGSRLSPG